ncbi:MAG: ferredoxin [Proteobacteria bacterium]|nr:ferredoxin [Pseudomonadota bacterium]MBU1709713.1 ferredoxin [Pseudomonadota bacterium]
MKVKILIDSYRCNSCGSCAELSPEFFFMDEVSEKAETRNETVDSTYALESTVAFCPTSCIELIALE